MGTVTIHVQRLRHPVSLSHMPACAACLYRGNTLLQGVELTSAQLGTLACPPATQQIPVNGNITCTGTYVVQQADLEAAGGTLTISAEATSTSLAGQTVAGSRTVTVNGSNSIATSYNRTIQLESWRALELNIAPAQNQSAWISQVGEYTHCGGRVMAAHACLLTVCADSLCLTCVHAGTVVQFVLTAANR